MEKKQTIILIVKNEPGFVFYRVNGFLRKMKIDPKKDAMTQIRVAEGLNVAPPVKTKK